MPLHEVLLLLLAGLGGGALNAAVGSGTLVLYPALLATGLSPVVANASNSIGMIPASAGGVWTYRKQLADQSRRTLVKWCIATATGGMVGAALVVWLPDTVFETVIPWLILAAVVLFAAQPYVNRHVGRIGRARLATPAVGAAGIYGGYFGAAQGIVYLAVIMAFDSVDLQKANAVKNMLVGAANAACGVVFILSWRVSWPEALVAAVGAAFGGLVGARLAEKTPIWLLRLIVIWVGLIGVVIAFRTE